MNNMLAHSNFVRLQLTFVIPGTLRCVSVSCTYATPQHKLVCVVQLRPRPCFREDEHR